VRGWAAVLLLAAVFLGHGLQCGSASEHTATAHTATAHGGGSLTASGAAPAADIHLTAPTAGHAADTAVMAAPAAHLTTGAATSGVTADHAPGHWHGLPGHLWAVCLAVLAAGLAVLLAVLAPRLLGPASSVAARLRRGAVWPALLRPPDLFSLCVQRI
jgi:hypothetical protein